MRAVLTSDEHHSETRRASDRGQFRFAVFALRSIRRNRRAAVRTFQCLSLHARNCTSYARAGIRALTVAPHVSLGAITHDRMMGPIVDGRVAILRHGDA